MNGFFKKQKYKIENWKPEFKTAVSKKKTTKTDTEP